MAVLRTWSDGWMTSARIISPDGQKHCVFGCLGKLDSLRHYARCPVMHRALRQALARPIPLPWMDRWGLSAPSLATYSAMAAAYNMYNEARLAPVWPLSPSLLRSCALAGVRAMQLASPLKCSEIDREQLGRRDYLIRSSSSSSSSVSSPRLTPAVSSSDSDSDTVSTAIATIPSDSDA
eukprot:7949419-Pyramimonas_sp.AAC.1